MAESWWSGAATAERGPGRFCEVPAWSRRLDRGTRARQNERRRDAQIDPGVAKAIEEVVGKLAGQVSVKNMTPSAQPTLPTAARRCIAGIGSSENIATEACQISVRIIAEGVAEALAGLRKKFCSIRKRRK